MSAAQIQTLSEYQAQVSKIELPKYFDLDAQILALEEELSSSLSVEQFSKNRLDQVIYNLKLARAGYYDQLPLEPLKNRDDNGLPVFALFDVNDNTAKFQFSLTENVWRVLLGWSGRFRISQSLPEPLAECFKDMHEHLLLKVGVPSRGGHIVRGSDVRLTTLCTGLIPTDIRKKIVNAQQSRLFERIFLIVEASDWKYEIDPVPQPPNQGDPLVVGYHKGQLFLIAAFYLTSVEQVLYDSVRPNG